VGESVVDDWDEDEDAEASEVVAADKSNADLPVDLVRPDLIERVFNSLTADAERGDGQLKRGDINRTYLRKQLTIEECIEVEGRLANANCTIVEEEHPLDQGDGEPNGPEGKARYLTHAEERELGRCIRLAAQLPDDTSHLDPGYVLRVKRDAENAKAAFVETNIRYVEIRAQRRGERRYVETEDLIQEGLIGLLRAVDLFDPERGFRFKTYATWWIDQRIERAIADDDRIVRLPVHLQERLVKIRRARSKLAFANGRSPTEGELADALGSDREKMMKLLWLVQATQVAEGDSLIGEEDTLLSIVPDQSPSQFDLVSDNELTVRIDDLLSTLTPREAGVIRMRFGLGHKDELTLEVIGQKYSVTRERIRQIEAKALKKLRHPTRSVHLRPFVDI